MIRHISQRIIPIHQKRAATLVEMMASMVIYVIIFGAFSMSLWATNRSWSRYQNMSLILNQSRNSLYRMSKELRMASNIVVTQQQTSSRVDFQLSSVPYYYIWSSTGANANKLLRSGPSGSEVLMDNVTALTLTQQSQFTDILLTTSRAGNTFSLRERVARRI